jgi:uncharacterized protein (TIGR00369 family)
MIIGLTMQGNEHMLHSSRKTMQNPTLSSPLPSLHMLGPLDLDRMAELRGNYHGECHACANKDYRLKFITNDENWLIARITPVKKLCSYPEILHGGVISLLIDEAMTCCLMAHGILGLTAELTLQYHHPVKPGHPLEIHTRVTRARPPLYLIESQLQQNGKTMLTAHAKFMQRTQQPSLT